MKSRVGRKEVLGQKTTDRQFSLEVPASCFQHPDRGHLRTICLTFWKRVGWFGSGHSEETLRFYWVSGFNAARVSGPFVLDGDANTLLADMFVKNRGF